MAKQVRTHSATSAIGSLLETIGKVGKVELAGNSMTPFELEDAKADAKASLENFTNISKDSNIITAMENLDDAIELQHQLEAEQEQQQIEG